MTTATRHLAIRSLAPLMVCALYAPLATGQFSTQPSAYRPLWDAEVDREFRLAAEAQAEAIVPKGGLRTWLGEARQPTLYWSRFPWVGPEPRTNATLALLVKVRKNGTVGELKLLGSAPPSSDPEESVLKAVRRWRYYPERIEGRRVETWSMVYIAFDEAYRLALAFPGLNPVVVRARAAEIKDRARAAGILVPPVEGLVPPVRLETPSPRYPRLALSAGLKPNVSGYIVIDRDGSVIKPIILLCHPADIGLEESFREELQTWRYTPATKDGKPVAVLWEVRTSFNFK